MRQNLGTGTAAVPVWGSVELDAGGTKEPSSYVALLGDQVLGFCTMWRNLFHPMALYFTVAVRPGWERRGIEAAARSS